jgi:hypothetical protein
MEVVLAYVVLAIALLIAGDQLAKRSRKQQEYARLLAFALELKDVATFTAALTAHSTEIRAVHTWLDKRALARVRNEGVAYCAALVRGLEQELAAQHPKLYSSVGHPSLPPATTRHLREFARSLRNGQVLLHRWSDKEDTVVHMLRLWLSRRTSGDHAA